MTLAGLGGGITQCMWIWSSTGVDVHHAADADGAAAEWPGRLLPSPLPPEACGTLELCAYRFTEDLRDTAEAENKVRKSPGP